MSGNMREEDRKTKENQLDFEEIYASYWSKIHRYVSRLAGSQEAEDLAQEVFIIVGNKMHTLRNKSQLSTWIYRIATNVAIDRMRKPDYRLEAKKPELLNSIIEGIRPINVDKKIGFRKEASLIERQAIQMEMNGCIRRVIDSLPGKYRTVIILSEIEGFKNKEIAEILAISIETVKVRLHRARAQLKHELLKHCNLYWDERNEMVCAPKNSTKT